VKNHLMERVIFRHRHTPVIGQTDIENRAATTLGGYPSSSGGRDIQKEGSREGKGKGFHKGWIVQLSAREKPGWGKEYVNCHR